jgi:UDP-N-acetylmuramoylalanine--D-glutamate ligase
LDYHHVALPRRLEHTEVALITMQINSTHTVLILGLGESGLACARWCAMQGATVRVVDTREQPPEIEALKHVAPQAQFISGELNPALLENVSVVVRSPGLSPMQLTELRAACQERGIAWIAELDLFMSALVALHEQQAYAPKIVAITGTNGKTTVTSMCGLMANRGGKKAVTAGNISPAMLEVLCNELQADEVKLPDVWCLELSSFQLDSVEGFNPHAATILNLTQDHGDWHADMKAYAAAKARVFGRQTVCVVNRDDVQTQALVPADAVQVSFGLDTPTLSGDWGLETTGSLNWLVRALPDETAEPVKKPRGKAAKLALSIETTLQRIMPIEALKIQGRHNQANALAALALLTSIDLPLAPMLHALREYQGEPHRVQQIATINGVDYVDDSKGTNVGATVAAIYGLARKMVLIVGGVGKGQDFAPLAAPVREYAHTVLIIGESADIIKYQINDACEGIEICESLEAAVKRASQVAKADEIVLLSPACASFDMFRNYKHRAQIFVDAVHALKAQSEVAEVQA